jgi:hypothetical protein
MANTPSNPPEVPDEGNDKVKSQTPNENLLAEARQMPLNLLIALATDDNVENSDGLEVKVDDVRNSSDNALLTKSELQKYDEYKRQWAANLERPQESLDALALREKQIIEAAQNHDWDALDKLKKQVDEDIEKMRYIFLGVTGA